MIFKLRTVEKDKFENKDWQKWFAWYPVLIGEPGQWQCRVWLEWVFRKRIGFHTGNGYYYALMWRYRLPRTKKLLVHKI